MESHMMAASVSERQFTGPNASEENVPIVFVVHDDPRARESLELLIRSAGWQPAAFVSADEFLAHPRSSVPTCILLDIDGLDLQERVAAHRSDTSVIFVTDRADVPATVRAMKGGAVDVLTKPLREDQILAAIAQAIMLSRDTLLRQSEMRALSERHASLTRREREVMALVVAGRLNKQVGAELGISEITVKAHRGMLMRKMRARSLPVLVHMALRLGVSTPCNDIATVHPRHRSPCNGSLQTNTSGPARDQYHRPMDSAAFAGFR
jgi:FixJ family two-component response regulator